MSTELSLDFSRIEPSYTAGVTIIPMEICPNHPSRCGTWIEVLDYEIVTTECVGDWFDLVEGFEEILDRHIHAVSISAEIFTCKYTDLGYTFAQYRDETNCKRMYRQISRKPKHQQQ